MRKTSKRFIAFFGALSMCLVLGLNVSAKSVNPTISTLSVNSSISGYGHDYLTKDHPTMLIYVSSEGIGGAGITVKTSCSGHYRIGLTILSPDMKDPVCYDRTFYTDSEFQFHELIQMGGNPYIVTLNDIPEGVTVYTEVWIYG